MFFMIVLCSATVIFQLAVSDIDRCRVDAWPVHEIKQIKSRSGCFLGECSIAVGYDDGRVRVWSTKVRRRGHLRPHRLSPSHKLGPSRRLWTDLPPSESAHHRASPPRTGSSTASRRPTTGSPSRASWPCRRSRFGAPQRRRSSRPAPTTVRLRPSLPAAGRCAPP
jgi:hypothetical protein